MGVETVRTVLIFPRQLIWGVTCLGLVLKNECFPASMSLESLEMCVETLRRGLHFFETDWFEGSHALVYSKNECFPIYLLRNPINVCWNPQNSACFSKMIDLRGHMPRLTLKNEHFPIYLLEKPHKCVLKLSEQCSFFPRQSIWGVTCLGLL